MTVFPFDYDKTKRMSVLVHYQKENCHYDHIPFNLIRKFKKISLSAVLSIWLRNLLVVVVVVVVVVVQ